ncbi:MAG: histidine kinase, partial [Anaerolineae bacterium]
QAIGDNLANPQVVLVALWEVLLQGEGERPTAVSLLAAWSAGAESDWQPGLQLTTAETGILLQLQPDSPLLVKIADLPADQSALWAAPGTKSVLFLPLLAASGHWAGILTIGSRAAGGFSRTEEHNYVTMGAQIALVLDNMRLVQKAQETAVLQERQRLAREIHDTLAQGFTSIVMHLEAAEQAMAHDAGTLQRHLNQARQTARDSLAQARRVVQDLRPEPLEAAALPDAIQQVAGKWEKQSGVKTAVAVTGDAFPLPPDAEVTLLRTAQEALANIRKHAAADDVRITLSYMADMVILDVQDNGVGLENTDKSPGERNGGYGLTAMRERVAQLNGTVLLESEPEEGTTLVVTIPVGGER